MKMAPIEDNLKILKVEYLSKHLLDYAHILNLSWDDQTIFLQIIKIKITSNERRPQKINSGIPQKPLIGS